MQDADQIVPPGRSFVELQQWTHDLRTPLSIISMGVEALQRVRHDDTQFAELTRMIVNEGIKPLNELFETLGNPDAGKST